MVAPAATALWLEYDNGVGPQRIPMLRADALSWVVTAADAGPGTRYTFRADGPYDPANGHRFNPAKLLIDPAARAIDGPIVWQPALCGRTDATNIDVADARDTAALLPRCVVVDEAFDWAGDAPLRTRWADTVIYECHVKGMTAQHPDVPLPIRGTYLGLAHPSITSYLRDLGVTAVELLPIHHMGIDRHVATRGLTNYWGYSTVGFFAPDARFASASDGRQVHEFKTMVRAMHGAGLEVILDVVYNHTAEGDALNGMQVSLRGLGNAEYYRLDSEDRSRYADTTGCGHTLRGDGVALDLMLASLRYWATEMHVDGFRFDLLPAICRDADGIVRDDAPLLQAIAADPALSACKLIAEPWDLGPDGYRLGRFPRPWAEWNGRTRDVTRRFWRGDAGHAANFATRLTGSSDLFDAARSALVGINYVACHDGFTLSDLVTYAFKRNLANLENNADGWTDAGNSNWGEEGPTTDSVVIQRREAAARAMLSSTLLSLGVPMLLHGDERCRTQQGNNNAYCHDSPLTWVDWQSSDEATSRTAFVRQLLALKRTMPAFHRSFHWPTEGPEAPSWLTEEGEPMSWEAWDSPGRHVLSVVLPNGSESQRVWLICSAAREPHDLLVPPGRWEVRLCSHPGMAVERLGPILRVPPVCLVVAELVATIDGGAAG